MDYGVTTLDELRGRLAAARRAWVRALVGPSGNEPAALLSLQAVVGVRPPAWHKQTWAYPQCTFASAQISTARLASLFEPGPQDLVVGTTRAVVNVQPGPFPYTHAPSLAQIQELKLPWPSFVYTPTLPTNANTPNGYLIGPGDVPSFPTFSAAYNAFFTGRFVITGTGNPQLGKISIHFADTMARILRVRVHPASLEVSLAGSSFTNAVLELNGAESRAAVTVDAPRIVFELPNGLPTDAWLWLKRGSEWLDFRPLSEWGGQPTTDVEIDLPEDPVTEVTRLAAQGEGTYLEYKVKLPDTVGEKRTVFKTIVAFANGNGGTVLFGVSDDGAITGLSGDLAVQRRRLMDLIRSVIIPPPEVRVWHQKVDGRGVLIADVSPGHGTLYALVIDANKPEYYVRRDGTTYYARPEELASTIGNVPAPGASPFGFM